MQTEPQAEHEWLQQLVGQWEFESEFVMEAGGTSLRSHGIERIRPLGKLWIIAEAELETPGVGTMQSVMTLGYLTEQQKFIGSWVASVMDWMFTYEGVRDAEANVLPLQTTGPSFEDPSEIVAYRDIIEIIGPDERLFRSEMPRPEGDVVRFMKSRYVRVT